LRGGWGGVKKIRRIGLLLVGCESILLIEFFPTSVLL